MQATEWLDAGKIDTVRRIPAILSAADHAMRISVTRVMGEPPAQSISFDFDARGGSIGRDPANEIVLPDPDRHISRVQARVESHGEQFFLVDLGANPSQVNGRPLAKGARAPLAAGDQITIAGYELRVEFPRPAPVFARSPVASAPADDRLGLYGKSADPGDPFGGLFEQAGEGEPSARAEAQPAVDDPFAPFFAPLQESAKSGPASASDSLSDPFARPPPQPVPRQPTQDVLGLGLGQEDSVDAIFGLEGSASASLADGPLGDPVPADSDEQAQVDPLAFLGVAPAARVAAPQRDDAPLLNQAISLPQAEASARPEETRLHPNEAPAGVGKRSLRAGVVVRSWEDVPALGGKPGRPVDGRPPAAVAPSAIPPAADGGHLPAPQGGSAVPVSADSAPTELLVAFQQGLGVRVDLPALTPELMERIGVLLREAAQGTVDLLKARAETKREVRAQVTMVVSKGNNPLKFSPDVGFALAQLLLPQGWGFMRPEEAMRDAYDDLRAHQFGFMAGMRAALSGVLSRFEPAALENRVAGRRLLDNLLPGSRKAKLWDLFEQMYGEISREASDDFEALFGREFVRAYEEQVARLQAEQNTE